MRPSKEDLEVAKQVRCRIVEVLELIADRALQLKYQGRAPHANVSHELFNQWQDWYVPNESTFRLAFTKAELDALATFDTWGACSGVPLQSASNSTRRETRPRSALPMR
jgi:hypothetical protein